MALTTTIIDQLIMGDKQVAKLVPGTVKFSNRLDLNARTRMEEVATYLFYADSFCSGLLPALPL